MFAHFCRPARIFRPNVSVSALHLCRMCVSDICLSNKQLLAVSRGFITSPKMKETTRISWDTLSGFCCCPRTDTLTFYQRDALSTRLSRPRIQSPAPPCHAYRTDCSDHLSLSKLSNVCRDLATLLPHPCSNWNTFLRHISFMQSQSPPYLNLCAKYISQLFDRDFIDLRYFATFSTGRVGVNGHKMSLGS